MKIVVQLQTYRDYGFIFDHTNKFKFQIASFEQNIFKGILSVPNNRMILT